MKQFSCWLFSSICFLLFQETVSGQAIFDLHNHLNLYGYLTDTIYDPIKSGYMSGSGRKTPLDRSWKLDPKTHSCPYHQGKQARFDRYAQTALSQISQTKMSIVVNSLYSMEKDLYDQRIVREVIGKQVSGLGSKKARYLGDFGFGGGQNHPSMFNDLMGLYYHQKFTDRQSPDKHHKILHYPVASLAAITDTHLVQVLFSVEGVHSLMDHSPLEYMRSVPSRDRILDLDMHDNQLGNRYLDTANQFLYTDRMLHHNMRRTFHGDKPGEQLCHNQHYPFYHSDMTERSKILYRILDFKTDTQQHAALWSHKNALPKYFEGSRLLYLTFSHFLNNGIIKQADVLDHQNFAIQFLITSAIKKGNFPGLNAFGHMQKKRAETFTPIGKEILALCLDKKMGFPIAIDVKHMDASTRFALYSMVDSLKSGKKTGIPDTLRLDSLDLVTNEIRQKARKIQLQLNPKVPLICSHAGVSMLPDMKEAIALEVMLDSAAITNRRAVLEAGRRRGHQVGRNGMLYPMPINLTDEDILKIAESGGIVGFNLDERILGNSMQRYSRQPKRKAFPIKNLLKEDLSSRSHLPLYQVIASAIPGGAQGAASMRKKEWKAIRKKYAGIEPLLRNVMHTQWVIKTFSTRPKKYPNLEKATSKENLPEFLEQNVSQSARNKLSEEGKKKYTKKLSNRDPAPETPIKSIDGTLWSTGFVCLGTDFDGIIDPLDAYKTVNFLEDLRSDFARFLPYYLALDPDRHTQDLLANLSKPEIEAWVEEVTENFFFRNGQRFTERFFNQTK